MSTKYQASRRTVTVNNVRRANYIFYCFLAEIFLLLIYLVDKR